MVDDFAVAGADGITDSLVGISSGKSGKGVGLIVFIPVVRSEQVCNDLTLPGAVKLVMDSGSDFPASAHVKVSGCNDACLGMSGLII